MSVKIILSFHIKFITNVEKKLALFQLYQQHVAKTFLVSALFPRSGPHYVVEQFPA